MADKTDIPSDKHTFLWSRNAMETKLITISCPLQNLQRYSRWRPRWLPKTENWISPTQNFTDNVRVCYVCHTLPHIHIMKTLGDLLQGSGLVEAEIATPGTVDSFLRAAHLIRSRRTHQTTAAALFILQRQAYDRWCHMHESDALKGDFEDWCHLRKHASSQFQYWATVLELGLLLFVYVRSLRQASFMMYLYAMTELAHPPLFPCLGSY